MHVGTMKTAEGGRTAVTDRGDTAVPSPHHHSSLLPLNCTNRFVRGPSMDTALYFDCEALSA
jgi:hypothetical protein